MLLKQCDNENYNTQRTQNSEVIQTHFLKSDTNFVVQKILPEKVITRNKFVGVNYWYIITEKTFGSAHP